VTLARPPKEITLLDVIEAIDGPIMLNECVGEEGDCSFEDDCPLRSVWSDAQEVLVKRLRGTNFQQLLERSKVAA
jgi:DNA-binding IscR family transcriptional regulator